MAEKWKWIEGCEGLYQISNTGKVKSFKREKDGKLMSVTNKDGWYLCIRVRNLKGEWQSLRIHQLVVKYFLGDVPHGYEIHHKDGNKQNNNVNNLEIIETHAHKLLTMKENPHFADGMNAYNKYGKPKHILQFDLDGNFMAEYANGAIAADASKVCQRNILQVASETEYKPGKIRKQAGGYIWKFKEESEVIR